MSGMLEEEC